MEDLKTLPEIGLLFAAAFRVSVDFPCMSPEDQRDLVIRVAAGVSAARRYRGFPAVCRLEGIAFAMNPERFGDARSVEEAARVLDEVEGRGVFKPRFPDEFVELLS